MARKRRHRSPLTEAEEQRIVKMKREGKSLHDIAKAVGCHQSTITRVIGQLAPELSGVKAATIRKNGHKPKTGRPKGKKTSQEKKVAKKKDDRLKYLTWVATGAIRGYVDRLLKDLASGELG
jgi:IS30 family transposase